MKISKITFVCSVLLALSLSISLVYALWDNFTGVIIYGAIALVISFVFLYYSISKYHPENDDFCFKLLFSVIVAFVSITVITCFCAAIYMSILMYTGNEPCESIFHRTLDPIQILCMPFLLIAIESAAIMTIKDTKICPE